MTMTQHPLRPAIESAFAGVPLPSGPLTRHRTPECEDLAAHLLGKRWQDFAREPMGFFKLVGQIPLLTPDAYTQFLPIYLLAFLEHPDRSSALEYEWILHCDAEHHGNLTLPQLAAVKDTLAVVGARSGFVQSDEYKKAVSTIDGLIKEKQKKGQ